MSKIKFLKVALVFLSTVGATTLHAQYYGGVYYDNYNNGYYGNSNNYTNYSYNQPTGYTTFIGENNGNYGYNQGYVAQPYYNNTNYNYGYNYPYNNNYVTVTNSNNSYYLTPTTNSATSIFSSGATVNGSISVQNNYYQSNYGTTWFQYGTNSSNLNWSTNPANIYGTTSANANLTGLQCSTTYYFRLVTRNAFDSQQNYGSILSFTTSPCLNNYYGNYYPQNNYSYYQPKQVNTNCYTPKKKKTYKY